KRRVQNLRVLDAEDAEVQAGEQHLGSDAVLVLDARARLGVYNAGRQPSVALRYLRLDGRVVELTPGDAQPAHRHRRANTGVALYTWRSDDIAALVVPTYAGRPLAKTALQAIEQLFRFDDVRVGRDGPVRHTAPPDLVRQEITTPR